MRLKNHLRQIDSSEEVSNKVSPKMISEMDSILLKRNNKTITEQLNRMAMDFRTG